MRVMRGSQAAAMRTVILLSLGLAGCTTSPPQPSRPELEIPEQRLAYYGHHPGSVQLSFAFS